MEAQACCIEAGVAGVIRAACLCSAVMSFLHNEGPQGPARVGGGLTTRVIQQACTAAREEAHTHMQKRTQQDTLKHKLFAKKKKGHKLSDRKHKFRKCRDACVHHSWHNGINAHGHMCANEQRSHTHLQAHKKVLLCRNHRACWSPTSANTDNGLDHTLKSRPGSLSTHTHTFSLCHFASVLLSPGVHSLSVILLLPPTVGPQTPDRAFSLIPTVTFQCDIHVLLNP